MNLECCVAMQTARRSAGYTQESAAEALEIGLRSLQKYEQGETTAPLEVVGRMRETYYAPELANRYCNQCPLGCHRHLPEERVDLQQQAIDAALLLSDPQRLIWAAKRLLEISRDKKVSKDEHPDYREIMREFAAVGHLAELGLIEMEHQEDEERSKRHAGKSHCYFNA